MKYDYDLMVIGGGAAGLVAATGGAALGARTALVERSRLGGDCTWYGCIPSKALLKAAETFASIRRLDSFGIRAGSANTYDPAGVMDHVRSVVREVSGHHPASLFEERGIRVIFGEGKFLDGNTYEVDGRPLRARRFILTMGSHPVVPPVEGLAGLDYLTNETIFDLESLPKSLAVLGGGPIGAEMAQAFSRLGVGVSIVEMAQRLLFREDSEISGVFSSSLEAEGIGIYTGKKAVAFRQEADGAVVTLEDDEKKRLDIRAEKVLVAAGRGANVSGLDLEKAGIRYSAKGVEVDAALRTSNPAVYAAGDVAGPYQFSHMAEYQAIVAVGNALFPFKQKVNYSAVPWCTFTEPEVARLGLTEDQARGKYAGVKVYRSQYRANDRAVTDRAATGFAKVVCNRRGMILGAHVIGAHAGETIHEYVVAKNNKLSLGKLSSSIHVYPTLAQVVKRSGDQYVMEILSAGWFKALTRFLLKFLR